VCVRHDAHVCFCVVAVSGVDVTESCALLSANNNNLSHMQVSNPFTIY